MYGDTDLDYLIGHDFGVAVVFGSINAVAQLDQHGVEVLHGHVSGLSAGDLSIYYRTGALPGIKIKSAISVGGVNYIVRNVQAHDQSTSRAELQVA